jgi:hypothetical protein
MVKLTRAQREALFQVFCRHPLDANADRLHGSLTALSYRQFRRMVQPILFGGGAVMVAWCGMFLAIEPDGYVHS